MERYVTAPQSPVICQSNPSYDFGGVIEMHGALSPKRMTRDYFVIIATFGEHHTDYFPLEMIEAEEERINARKAAQAKAAEQTSEKNPKSA